MNEPQWSCNVAGCSCGAQPFLHWTAPQQPQGVHTEPYRVVGERGNVQYEWHQDGWDIEVEFTAEGRIDSVFVGRADA